MMGLGRRALALAAALTVGFGLAVQAPADGLEVGLAVGTPKVTTEVNPNKIDVMGVWAHPDDEAGMVTPCGIWNDKYDVKCGIIMLTRGEGGSNSVGSEASVALGLRRENEDRASHYRSGTLDIYNIDAPDFFYNTSGALTAELWNNERLLRQTVRVIRQTQPELVISFPPLTSGHGHHQTAGRIMWEAIQAAADPAMFPEQLTGADAVKTWQVKGVYSNWLNHTWSTPGTGGQDGPECNTGFVPSVPYTVVGTWTGVDSPYKWLPGNIQGMTAGSPMSWAQVGREGYLAHATQARSKLMGTYAPTCQRYGFIQSEVPFQPNGDPDNARDDALFFGSVIPDPGGFPLGSTYAIDVEDYFQAPGVPFKVTVRAKSGGTTIPAGKVTLQVPAGWTVSGDNNLGPITSSAVESVTFTVTPAATEKLDAKPENNVRGIKALFDNGTQTAYNDTRVELVSGVEGRFQRWGNYSQYEEWAAKYTWSDGRSTAERQIGAGESVTIPVVVTNRTDAAASGAVALNLPAPLTADQTSATFANLAPGAETTLNFVVTHTDKAALGGKVIEVPIVTTSGTMTSTETLKLYEVPTTVIPKAATAPTLDGAADAGYGPALNIGRKWEGNDCNPDGTDCGAGSTVQLAWSDDALYAVATVVDDKASAAATPDRCFGHWLVDSVEVLLDPMGGSRDTSTTYKTGILPFTDDPTGAAGQGVNGACWSRDADNHQGFSSGPLAETIKGGVNAPGQEVAVKVTRNSDGTFAGGKYTVEVKIALADLPAAVVTGKVPSGAQASNDVDPKYLGLNVTPYDSDVQTFIGKTRTAWSPFGSQQSEPYRWGHAYLEGYTAPAGRATTPKTPIIPDTAAQGVESPQTIYQSANRGVTISGLEPSHALTIGAITFDSTGATIPVTAKQAGTIRVYAWDGMPEMVPVWKTSCAGDPLGFSACADTDNTAAPWAPDMGGRLKGSLVKSIPAGASTIKLPLSAEALVALRDQGRLLISFLDDTNKVQAWDYPIVTRLIPSPTPSTKPTVTVTSSPKPTTKPSPAPSVVLTAPYEIPGLHLINGRQWYTTCEPYSQTFRCRTDIWATTVQYVNGKFVQTTGWVFNNLTYLPYMTKAQWGANPLANPGTWTSGGYQWRTECNTAATGSNACRNYIYKKVIASKLDASGTRVFYFVDQWVMNSIVRFKV